MSRGIITPRERKPIIEAEEDARILHRRLLSARDLFHSFRTLVSGAGTKYDEALDTLANIEGSARSLASLVGRARRDYRALEKHLAKCTPRNDPGPFTAPSAKRKR